jgi:L-alanine-DL-glutamate epimerase-like enolase superfamily enzyme
VATIAKLEIIPLIYRLPAGRAYGMARGLTSIRQASLVKLTTDEGVEGIGEAWGPSRWARQRDSVGMPPLRRGAGPLAAAWKSFIPPSLTRRSSEPAANPSGQCV